MDGDRRLRTAQKPGLRIAAVWFLISAIMVVLAWPRIAQGRFPESDDVLRLLQVRDLLAGQGWFDLHQYRIDPPHGTPMPWSRLVDLPLLAAIGLLAPLAGQPAAEAIAVIVVPLLSFGATMWVVGRLAWRLLGTRVAACACLACGFLPALLFQFQPMRIDHHGWQVFTVAVALWAVSWREGLKGGAMAGLAMAVGLSISLELLPFAAAFAAVLAWRWLGERHQRWWLVAYVQTLALALVALYAATRGIADLRQHCDAISPAHLGFFIVAALGIGAIGLAERITRLALVVLIGLAGAAGLAFFALSAPVCLATPFAGLDSSVRDFWYLDDAEGKPLWLQSPERAVPALLQMVVALGATLALRARSADWLRRWWGEYAFLLALAILTALFVSRSLAFASVVAAIPLGWLTAALLARLRARAAPLAKAGAVAAIVLLLVPSAPVTVASQLAPAALGAPNGKFAQSGCDVRTQAGRLAVLPPGTVFAPLDIGPGILLETDHAVVATGHHRAAGAMADVIKGFTLTPDEARPFVARHGADYLALCTDVAEPRLYAARHPDGLAAALLADRSPAWLEKIEIAGAPPEFAVYRVRR